MNTKDLKSKLDELGIPEGWYSLNGELNYDNIILYKNYDKWEVFYFSEKGEREDMGIFNTEAEACSFIYTKINDYIKLGLLNIPISKNLDSVDVIGVRSGTVTFFNSKKALITVKYSDFKKMGGK